MSDLKQFLDWSGLKHYDAKIKDYIGDRTCSIGEDGYWYIGGVKTEYMAVGQDGKDGVDGAPGKDGVDGAPGQDGQDGTSISITSTDKVDGVTTITFSDGNTITINDGQDGQDGEDGDELNLQLGEEITTNVACGALGIGQTLGADLTLADIVKKLTTTVYKPKTGNAPKATLTMSNQSETTVEVGTTINPTLTPSFTDGTFKTYGQGVIEPTNMNAGCDVTNYTISRSSKQGNTTTTETLFDSDDSGDGFTGLAAYDDTYTIGEETVTYKTTISYSASTKYPQDSNGDEDTTVIWDGSSASANSTSVTGKYQYYAGCSDIDPTADEIRAALNDTENWIDPSKTVDIVNTNTKMIFAIPASYSLVSAISSTKEPQTDNFVKSQITIKDAGGNDVLYNLYIMTNSLVGNFTTTFKYKKGQ
mgnify:CR=1 FL=1